MHWKRESCLIVFAEQPQIETQSSVKSFNKQEGDGRFSIQEDFLKD